MRFRSIGWKMIPAAVLMAVLAVSSPAATCDSLVGLRLDNVTITAVESVGAGAFELAGGRGGPRMITDLPAFCRVTATLTPTTDSAIRMELWMPSPDTWNRRYLAVGNGAFAGTIGTNAMLDPLRRGYVTSSTDTGHEGNQGAFALNENLMVDFAYRAVHEMAETSKTLIDAFYEAAPTYSYFNGCSTGGRQALTAAQRYPLDFDGIVGGAPAIYASHLQGAQVWMGRLGEIVPGGRLTAESRVLLADAAVNACDLNDGVADGVIGRPDMCRFDPLESNLICGTGSSPAACLTPAEATLASRMYEGPKDANGGTLFPGLARGSERGWGGILGPEPMALAADVYRYFVYQDADWDYRDFDAATDIPYGEQVLGESLDAIDPDLSVFVGNGGKLLIYHGWADWGISPYNSVNYYQSVVDRMGPDVDSSVRLFMLPGVGHCSGGEGPDTWDSISAIDAWVTDGDAPDRIVASRIREGAPDRTRPLCAYPAQAVYDGTGSTDEASNFVCQ
jgi:feruloyl esterase